MKKRKIRNTDLVVSEIGIGCWAIGGPFMNLGVSGGWSNVNEKDAEEGLESALQQDANLFDTADVYGFGKSERLIGRVIKKSLISRKQLVIVSKTGYFSGCAVSGYHPLHMKHQLEMSLENLQTKYIDIYFFHHHDFGLNNEYLENALNTMFEFKSKGYIKYIGLRGPHSYSLNRGKNKTNKDSYSAFISLSNIIKPDIISVRYNMITSTYDMNHKNIFRWAKKQNVGVITYKPLGQGLLLDKYDSQNPPIFELGDHRIRKTWYTSKGLMALKKRLELIKSRFNITNNQQMVNLCIQYVLSRDDSLCCVVGFKNKKQIDESLSTTGCMSKKDVIFIQQIFKDIDKEIGKFVDFNKDAKALS